MTQYKNTVNTSTHITKTPTHTHTDTLQNLHVHNHILQNKLKQPRYKMHTNVGFVTMKWP